jgi:hypothetical protein
MKLLFSNKTKQSFIYEIKKGSASIEGLYEVGQF